MSALLSRLTGKLFRHDMMQKAGIDYLISKGATSEAKAIPLTNEQILAFGLYGPSKTGNHKWIKQTLDVRFWTAYDELEAAKARNSKIVSIISLIVIGLTIVIATTIQ